MKSMLHMFLLYTYHILSLVIFQPDNEEENEEDGKDASKLDAPDFVVFGDYLLIPPPQLVVFLLTWIPNTVSICIGWIDHKSVHLDVIPKSLSVLVDDGIVIPLG